MNFLKELRNWAVVAALVLGRSFATLDVDSAKMFADVSPMGQPTSDAENSTQRFLIRMLWIRHGLSCANGMLAMNESHACFLGRRAGAIYPRQLSSSHNRAFKHEHIMAS